MRGAAQKRYFNYPPKSLLSYKAMAKALVQRFKEGKIDEEFLSHLGKIKQKRSSVRQFVEEIKDLTRQLTSPPGWKSLRAWFLNEIALKGLAKAKITSPTRRFEELVQRDVKMEWKRPRSKSLAPILPTLAILKSPTIWKKDWPIRRNRLEFKTEDIKKKN